MGVPLAPQRLIVLQQAAEWYALLESGTAGEKDRVKWQRWLAADPLHAAAWHQVQDISGQFRDLPPASARAVLMAAAPPSHSRRALVAMLVAAASGVAYWKLGPGVEQSDDAIAGTDASVASAASYASDATYTSAIGQLRRLRLPDGGTLLLDTDTAVEIAYGDGARRIVLRRGRMYIETAPDIMQPPRPLLVQTGQGVLRALGTRFEVDQLQGRTRLQVDQGAVEITPRHVAAQAVVVPAGAAAQFDAAAAELNTVLEVEHKAELNVEPNVEHNVEHKAELNVEPKAELSVEHKAELDGGATVGRSAGPTTPARLGSTGAAGPSTIAAPGWTRRLLLADNLPLGDLVRELARYRRGYLGCAPEVAGLRLVGAYPLDDHEAVFAMLEASLPVRVRKILPWWVTIDAR